MNSSHCRSEKNSGIFLTIVFFLLGYLFFHFINSRRAADSNKLGKDPSHRRNSDIIESEKVKDFFPNL